MEINERDLAYLGREKRECINCFDRSRLLLFLPCLHYVNCLTCVRRLNENRCPFCRTAIQKVRMENGRVADPLLLAHQFHQKSEEDEQTTIQVALVGTRNAQKNALMEALRTVCVRNEVRLPDMETDFAPNCSTTLRDNESRMRITVTTMAAPTEHWGEHIISLRPDLIVIVRDETQNEVEEYEKWIEQCRQVPLNRDMNDRVVFATVGQENISISLGNAIRVVRQEGRDVTLQHGTIMNFDRSVMRMRILQYTLWLAGMRGGVAGFQEAVNEFS